MGLWWELSTLAGASTSESGWLAFVCLTGFGLLGWRGGRPSRLGVDLLLHALWGPACCITSRQSSPAPAGGI